MDEMLARLNRIYKDSKFALIPKYRPEQWIKQEYNSHLDYKAAVNKWRSAPLSYTEAQEAVEDGMRVGWIIPKGYVVVDIDNVEDGLAQEYIERLLNKFEVEYSYNYTSRGIHILLKDPTQSIKSGAKMKCGLNIVIDTRANETGYIVLPCNDPHRQWGKWHDSVEDIPYFLKPICNDSTPSFIGMTDGDGRNDALFKWRSKLETSRKLNDEEIEKCIKIINENLFDTAITNAELYKTVLRKHEQKEKPNVANRPNILNQMADELLARYDIISYGDKVFKFNGVYYKPISTIELEQMIHIELSNNLNRAQRVEIINFIRVKAQVKEEDFNKDWYKLAARNGIINLVTGELQVPNKAEYNTIYIPWAYNTDPVYSPRIDQFMKDLCDGDPIKMQFLYQVAGYTLLKKNLFSKFFIFKGEGGTGKSTFTNIIALMLGEQNCSHIALTDFDKDYHLATMGDKLCNIDDDVVDGKTLQYTGRFKSIISGDEITVRQIYAEPVTYTSFTTCMFSCNRLPMIMDKTTGLYRRMILIELNHKIEKPDPLFIEKLTESDMEYFIYKAVQAIKAAIEEGRFRITQSEQHLLQLFKRRQSPLHEWLYDCDYRTKDFVNKRCMTMYKIYRAWAEENGYQKLVTMYTFKEDICALYDMETRMGTTDGSNTPTQIFVKIGECYDEDYKPF